MNQKALEALLVKIRELIGEWPLRMVVWHIADGRRGVISGARICGDGSILPEVIWGGGTCVHYPFELRQAKVPENLDGDEWRGADSG